MNKSFVLIGILTIVQSVHTAHLSLNPHTKCAFARKRLEMTYAHLAIAQQELMVLEKALISSGESEFGPERMRRRSDITHEIMELKKTIPVLEKSLYALCKTIQ
jgi:hypothetical protein